MKVAADSSALAKRYVEEAGSERLEQILQDAAELGLCILSVPEILSGLNRRLREHALAEQEYRRAKEQLLADAADATALPITSEVVSLSVELLETNVLRAMDALHVACALQWSADLFVTADKRQAAAARRAELRVAYLGE